MQSRGECVKRLKRKVDFSSVVRFLKENYMIFQFFDTLLNAALGEIISEVIKQMLKERMN